MVLLQQLGLGLRLRRLLLLPLGQDQLLLRLEGGKRLQEDGAFFVLMPAGKK